MNRAFLNRIHKNTKPHSFEAAVCDIISQAFRNFSEAPVLAVTDPYMEIIRIPCLETGYATFPHEQSYPFSMKKVREEAETWLYNHFRKEGFRVTVKIISTDDEDYGTEYWKSIKIDWNAPNKANCQRGKRPTRSRK